MKKPQLKVRIIHLIANLGPMTAQEMAEELSSTFKSTRNAAYGLVKYGFLHPRSIQSPHPGRHRTVYELTVDIPSYDHRTASHPSP